MFQYSEAIFVSPVVDHFAKEKHGDVLLPRRLRVIEAVALRTQMSVMRTRDDGRENWRTLELHAAGIERVRHVLLPVLWPVILSDIYRISQRLSDLMNIPLLHRPRRTHDPGQ